MSEDLLRPHARRYSPWPRRLGIALVVVGIAANPWFLAVLFTRDGSIDWVGYEILAWIFSLVCVAGGVWTVRRTPAELADAGGRLALGGASLLVGAILVELLLRLGPGPVFHPSLHLYPHRDITFRAEIPGVSDTVRITTNAWGLRGDPIPADWAERPTVVTVGGSTTKCSFLPDDRTWPARMQDLLRRHRPGLLVQNAGLTGHSTRGHLLLMERVVTEIAPDMVLYLVGVNDLALSLHADAVERHYQSPGWHYTVFAHSRLVQRLVGAYRVLVSQVPVERPGEVVSKDLLALAPLENPSSLPADLRQLLPSLPYFRANVRELIRRSRFHGIEPVFATQPLLFGEGDPWEDLEATTFWFGSREIRISAATYWRLLEIFNHSVLEVCAEEKVPCFDLAEAVPHDRRYFYDEMHLTEAGAERVAQELAQFLASGGLVPGADPGVSASDAP